MTIVTITKNGETKRVEKAVVDIYARDGWVVTTNATTTTGTSTATQSTIL
jgi:hypothetical protein